MKQFTLPHYLISGQTAHVSVFESHLDLEQYFFPIAHLYKDMMASFAMGFPGTGEHHFIQSLISRKHNFPTFLVTLQQTHSPTNTSDVEIVPLVVPLIMGSLDMSQCPLYSVWNVVKNLANPNTAFIHHTTDLLFTAFQLYLAHSALRFLAFVVFMNQQSPMFRIALSSYKRIGFKPMNMLPNEKSFWQLSMGYAPGVIAKLIWRPRPY
jgi:hypothetical protein